MKVCIYDNRPDSEIGIRLLLESLCRNSPDCIVHVYFAPASADFRQWVGDRSHIKLILRDFGPLHWNVKPIVLMEELKSCNEVVWLDSDVVVTSAIDPMFANLGPDEIVLAEEAAWGNRDDQNKAASWGLPVGRSFDATLNTCVLRLTKSHEPLLRDWLELLQGEPYLSAQKLPYQNRPSHLFGDQDVLAALLSSKKHADIPVRILRRGVDILQVFGLKGFTVRERLHAVRRLPTFIHAQGQKPWLKENAKSFKDYIETAYRDASPLVILADREGRRIEANTLLGNALRFAGFGSVALSGLPLAILFDLAFGAISMIRR